MSDKPVKDNRMKAIVERLGVLKDGFLVLAGTFYVFGYMVWAIHASSNKLGLLPALEFQYFVAGIVPVAILSILYFIVKGIRLLRERLVSRLDPDDGSVRTLGGALRLASRLSFGLLILFVLVRERLHVAQIWVSVALVIFAVFSLVAPPPGQHANLVDWFARIYAWFVGVLFAIVLPVTAFIFFVTDVYPKIPQELGGARPRHVCLDLVREQISKDTIKSLTFDQGATSEPILRTPKLELMFSGSDVVVVRSQSRVFEITRGAVRSVTPCE